MARCGECGKEVESYWVRGREVPSLDGYGRCTPCADHIRESRNFPRTFELTRGDTIKIIKDGRTHVGTVLTASWEGVHYGWFVEFTRQDGGYGYYKQTDGGTLSKEGVSIVGAQRRSETLATRPPLFGGR